MSTMNISLPESLKAYVDERVTSTGYGTSSEYIRELIRRDQDKSRLYGLLMDGARSPVTGVADDAYFESLRSFARQQLATGK